MIYHKTVVLKDGSVCLLRNGTQQDGQAALKSFLLTHEQTDYLLSYPDEIALTVGQEAAYLKKKEESEDEIELLAERDGKVVGLAGVAKVGAYDKVRRRAELGISIEKEAWGLGIGRALTRACIACAKEAEYAQLELSVVAENQNAVALYQSEGFVEYGRNPRGFYSRLTGWQELILMRLALTDDTKSPLPAVTSKG